MKHLKTLKIAVIGWFNHQYRFQLVVPEYKAVHVCKNLSEVLEWNNLYPLTVRTFVIPPKSSEWDWNFSNQYLTA